MLGCWVCFVRERFSSGSFYGFDVREQNRGKAAAGSGKSSSATPDCCPLEHLKVAVGVAKRGDGAASNVTLNANGLAFVIIDQLDGGQLHKHRFAIAHFKLEQDWKSSSSLVLVLDALFRERGTGRNTIECIPHGVADFAQRKPMWLMPVSEGVPRRALGR